MDDDAPTVDPDQAITVDINSVVLTGYLVTDPQPQPTRRGRESILIRLAFRRFDATDYVDVLVSAPDQVQIASKLRNGQRLLVTGQLRQQRWKSRRHTTRCKHAIVATSLDPLPRPPGANTPDTPPSVA